MTQILGADPQAIERAARCLRDGGLVAFPTETVYGLGVHALNVAAVRRLFAAKGRPANDPLIVHVASLSDIRLLTIEIPQDAIVLAQRFWPGPLTLVMPRAESVPLDVTAGLDTVAIRVPSHPVARALIEAADIPIAAPSANLFSRPSPTTAAHVLHDLEGRIDLVIDGGPTTVGVESSVVDLTVSPPRLLRPGGVPFEELRQLVPSLVFTAPRLEGAGAAASPGLLTHHYSPRTPTLLLSGTRDGVRSALVDNLREGTAAGRRTGVLATTEQLAGGAWTATTVADLGPESDVEGIARRLYAALRELDEAGLDLILVADPPHDEGLWRAIRDRLSRAAQRQVRSG